jgi:uncharacterized protein YbbC (DUF1343 family)
MAYDRTGLLWVNPSPNMRNLVEAFLYPGVGWLEATNLATGRGTDTPFERLGAPWIDPVAFSNALNASGVKGVRFTPIWFSPTERQYKGERCGGVQIMITHLDELDPVAMGVRLAVTLRALYPNDWKPEGLLKLLCHRRAYQAIVEGKPAPQVEALWQADLQRFKLVRMNYLLYERGDR